MCICEFGSAPFFRCVFISFSEADCATRRPEAGMVGDLRQDLRRVLLGDSELWQYRFIPRNGLTNGALVRAGTHWRARCTS